MLQIKLGDRKHPGPGDLMGRDWIGYDPTESVEALFACNRGVWKLGSRAEFESHVAFAYTGDQEIKFVAEIYGFERFGDRRAIVGRVLGPDDPLSRQWIGSLARGNYQNPVHYVPDDPLSAPAESERPGARPGTRLAGPASKASIRRPSSGIRARGWTARWMARAASDLPTSRLAWAREWFQRLNVPGESEEYLTGVEQWRNAWKPNHVTALLVAESHVAQADGDDSVKVRLDPALSTPPGLPDVYVRLVYCLGYGNNEVCYPRPPENNRGTDDFWEIFERIATRGQRHAGQPLPAHRTARRIAILERLAERGIWLEDASPIGLYLPGGQRLTNDDSTRKAIVQEGWSGYVWPRFAADPPGHIWVIGRTVSDALQGMDGMVRSQRVMQPSYARRTGTWPEYQAELDAMADQLATAAP